MHRIPNNALALILVFGLLAPGAGLAAKFELTEASNGFRRVFDSQIKAKKFPRISMAWLVEGSFPAGSQRSIQCTASVLDAPPQGGRPTPRKGVKMTLRGEILDAATGDTLQMLGKKKKKTDQNGLATIEFPLAEVENFYAVIEGRLKKKTVTTGEMDCAVVIEPVGQAASSGLSVQARQLDGEEVDTEFFARTGKRASGGPVKAKKWESIVISVLVDRVSADSSLEFELRAIRAAGSQKRWPRVLEGLNYQVESEMYNPGSGLVIAASKEEREAPQDGSKEGWMETYNRKLHELFPGLPDDIFSDIGKEQLIEIRHRMKLEGIAKVFEVIFQGTASSLPDT